MPPCCGLRAPPRVPIAGLWGRGERIARVSRDETEARDLREGRPADNSPLARRWTQVRSRLSGDVGHGGLGAWGRARDPVAFADVVEDARDDLRLGEGVFMLHPLSKYLESLGWSCCARLFADGSSWTP